MVFALLAAFGALLAWIGANYQVEGSGDWMPGAVAVGGSLLALGCTIWLIKSLFHARGKARLEAGIGLVARWHVGPIDWEKYRAADAARVQSDPRFLVNDLWLRKTTPPEGVEVIVGRKALIVDDSYHVLRMNGLPELRSIGWLDNSATLGRPPDCLEFLLAYPRGRYGGIQYTCLRVPVPTMATREARKAYDQFAPALQRRQAKGAIALRNPRRTLQVCGAIFALGLAAVAWGLFEAQRTDWNSYDTMTPILLLASGGIGMIFAVLLGSLTLLMRPRAAR